MPPATPARQKDSIEVHGPLAGVAERILTVEAREFLAQLARIHGATRNELLAARQVAAARRDAGQRLEFLSATRAIRETEWRVAPIPRPLQRRIVEITGPVDRKMIINALNSGADVFMADCEDSTAPSFANLIDGQQNLRDAVRREIALDDPARGKRYTLNETTATLLVRPRGLHLPERHFKVDGEPIAGALFDFGLYVFHNAAELVRRGAGPWFYLPKLEHHLEARWWNDVFVTAQKMLSLPNGTIKATVLIETLPAAFQMDEILFELRDHAAGLNCGRWDYIFSFIKCHRADPNAVLPDRAQVTMEQPFLRAYTQLLVKTCHRRGAFAMGGMAAQIPIKDDAARNAAALEKVRNDKLREVRDGHDGTWVAHPALVQVAREAFATHLNGDNQLTVTRADFTASAEDLLRLPTGTRSEEGVRHNVRVGVRYLEAWLRGVGCVPLYDLMEDAATAEISRAQLWHWIHHAARLADGRVVDAVLLRDVIADELRHIKNDLGPAAFERGRFDEARELFERLCLEPQLEDFLTLRAYERI
jgi:malate synthase